MNILQGIILGLVQGLTEFLPVSSSGHLVLFQNAMGIDSGNMLFFNVMVHVGTLVAIFVVFWKDIVSLLRHPVQKLMGLLIVATVPAVIAQLLIGDFIEESFGGQYLGVGFLLTAVLLTVAEVLSAQKSRKKKEISYPNALGIGCMQAVAVFPGISRSGSTLAGSLFMGLDRSLAAKFSFLMSIPVILGSTLLEGYKLVTDGAGAVFVWPTILGMIAAGLSGYFAVRFMLNLIRKRKMYGFAIYVLVLGLLVILDQSWWHLIFK